MDKNENESYSQSFDKESRNDLYQTDNDDYETKRTIDEVLDLESGEIIKSEDFSENQNLKLWLFGEDYKKQLLVLLHQNMYVLIVSNWSNCLVEQRAVEKFHFLHIYMIAMIVK